MRIFLIALLIFVLSSAGFFYLFYQAPTYVQSMIFGLTATAIYLAVVGLRTRNDSTIHVILKCLFMGFLGYLFMLMFYKPYLVPVIFGLLIAAVYFTAVKLQAINEEYAAKVKNGVKWMKISILLGILPYLIYLFFYLITSNHFPDGIVTHPIVLGPLFGVMYVIEDLFPGNKSIAFIVISLWLFLPLIIGFFIYKKRRNYKRAEKNGPAYLR